MKKLLAGLAAAVFALGPVACNQSNEGGHPQGSNNPVGPSKSGYTLHTGPGATHLKPGEEKTVTVTVDRGKEFTDPVSLKAESQDKAVKADLAKTTAEPGDKEVTMTVKADKDAPQGDHIIKVVGTSKGGTPTTLEVKVTVDKP